MHSDSHYVTINNKIYQICTSVQLTAKRERERKQIWSNERINANLQHALHVEIIVDNFVEKLRQYLFVLRSS